MEKFETPVDLEVKRPSISTLRRLAKITSLVGMSLLATVDKTDGQEPGDSVPMQEQAENSSKWKLDWPGAHFTFFSEDENGEKKFNPWSLIAPVQIEAFRNIESESEMEFRVPYEYSRLFNLDPKAKEALRPEDYEKMTAYVDNEIKKGLSDKVHGLGKSIYALHHEEPGLSHMTVTDIQVTGTASPEGPREDGPSTIISGKTEEENRDLAEARAQASHEMTKERLTALGIDVSQLPAEFEATSLEEIQFTELEMSQLSLLAEGMGGVDDLENIYNLIIAYNEGQITDSSTRSALDTILGQKRGAEITVSYEGDQKESWLLPLPLLLLLIPLLRRRRRGDHIGPAKHQIPENQPSPVSPAVDPAPEVPVSKSEEEVLPAVREVDLPEEGSPEYNYMVEETLTGDIYVFFDNADSVRRGVDYRQILNQMEEKFDSFPSDEARESYLTAVVIKAWKEHDLAAREEAGVGAEEYNTQDRAAALRSGLDYENQDNQIKWARIHARELLEMVKTKNSLPPEESGKADYLNDILSPRVRKLLQDKRLTK